MQISEAKVLAAAIQLDSQEDEEANWAQAEALCRAAAGHGAGVLALPENMLYEGKNTTRRDDIEDRWLPRIRALAEELGAGIIAGSMREAAADPDETRTYNTCMAVDATGALVGRYRKIHLFDIDLPGGLRHLESAYLLPGKRTVTCELGVMGTVGLSICYDLRFPELYRALTDAGALTLFVPSSFTKETGKDHWFPLLRARAIENQCFVIAPNQIGLKGGKLAKYGRSTIIDPWGTVLATAPDGPSFCLAELDFGALARVRASLPVHDHAQLR